MSLVRKLLLAGTIGLVGLLRSFTTVPAGHVTVLNTFGSVAAEELQPGLHFPVNPLARRIQMETRTLERKEAITVPTNEGLNTTLDVSILYSLESARADEVYKTLGNHFGTSLRIIEVKFGHTGLKSS